MQLLDPTLLIALIGLPPKHLNRALSRELDIYGRATSNEGLLCIRKYWDAHCSTVSKLPAIALLDQSSYPRGISDLDFLALLSRLTSLQQWQIWGLRSTLDKHGCGFVGCPEFTLLVVLMCSAVAGQQLQAVHSYHNTICRVFTGAHVGGTLAGLTQCCQLLQLPFGCLVTAVQQLQVTVMPPTTEILSSSSSSSSGCFCGVTAVTPGKPSSSSCCPCSSCSCRHLGGVQTIWQEHGTSVGSKRACLCSSRAGPSEPYRPTSSSSSSSSGSSSGGGRCCSCSSTSKPDRNTCVKGSCAAAATVSVTRTAASGKCQPQAQGCWQDAADQDVQLILFTTIQLAQGELLPYATSCSADVDVVEETRTTNKSGFCSIGCMFP